MTDDPIDQLAADQGSAPDPIAAAERLNALLSLPESAGVRGARLTGQGSRAAVEVDLANGDTMEFESVRDMTRPANLVAEVAACAGVAVTIKQPAAVQAVVLVRAIAERTAGVTDNDQARDWGISYLQTADTLDVDLDDQHARWGAFARLRDAERGAESAESAHESTYAGATIVLRAHDGTRLVRTGWYRTYVARQKAATVSRQDVAVRMLRVGWQLRGKSGRIKATCPGRPGVLSWAFLLAPDGWETRQ